MDDTFLILDYDILKNNNDDVEILWNGNVTLSSQLVDCMIPSVVQDDMKIYAVVDQRLTNKTMSSLIILRLLRILQIQLL